MKHTLLILSLLIANIVSAQKNAISTYFRIGYNNNPHTDSKLMTIAPGRLNYSSHFYGIGAEVSWKSNKNILAMEGLIYAHGAVSQEDEYAEPFVGTASLKTGYIIYESDRVFVYPSVGVGLSGIGITSYNKQQEKKYNIHTTYLLSPAFDLGLNADHVIYRFHTARPTGAFTVAVRAGYRWSRKSNDWKRVENPEFNNVSIANNGFYVGIGLGVAYLTK